MEGEGHDLRQNSARRGSCRVPSPAVAANFPGGNNRVVTKTVTRWMNLPGTAEDTFAAKYSNGDVNSMSLS